MQPANQHDGGEGLWQRYLLGDLSAQEQDQIEEQYFASDDQLDRLLAAEQELIDNYLLGNLTPAEQLKFERNYLTTPEKKHRLELARQLRTRANETAHSAVAALRERPQSQKGAWLQNLLGFLVPRNPAARGALVFGVLVILFGSLFFVNRNAQLRRQLEEAQQQKASWEQSEKQIKQQLEDQQRRNDELTRTLEQTDEQRRLLDEALSRQRQLSVPVVPSFELGAGAGEPRSTFGPGAKKPQLLVIPKDTKLIRLTYRANDTGYQGYRIVLVGESGTELWNREDRLDRSRLISIHIPARLLSRGDYQFRLLLKKADQSAEAVKIFPVRVQRP